MHISVKSRRVLANPAQKPSKIICHAQSVILALTTCHVLLLSSGVEFRNKVQQWSSGMVPWITNNNEHPKIERCSVVDIIFASPDQQPSPFLQRT